MINLSIFCQLGSIAAAAVMLQSCVKRPDNALMAAIEKENVAAGMRPINMAWQLRKNDGRNLLWVYQSSHRWAGSVAKSIALDGQSLLWQEDCYYSGRIYKSIEIDNMTEMLVVYYDYTTKKCSIRLVTDNMELEKMVSDSLPINGGDPKVACAIAEKILKIWNASLDE